MTQQQLSISTSNFLKMYLKEHDLNKTTRIDRRLNDKEQILNLLNQSLTESEQIATKIAKLSDNEIEELKSFLNIEITKYEKWKIFENKILLSSLYVLICILIFGSMIFEDQNIFILISSIVLSSSIFVYIYMFFRINKYYYNYKLLQKKLLKSIY